MLVHEMLNTLAQIQTLVDGEARDQFLVDKAKPHALAMFFVILGEAASKVSKSLQAEHPDVPWQRVANLRHLIAHEYRRIDHDQLWAMAAKDAPQLRSGLPVPPPSDQFD